MGGTAEVHITQLRIIPILPVVIAEGGDNFRSRLTGDQDVLDSMGCVRTIVANTLDVGLIKTVVRARISYYLEFHAISINLDVSLGVFVWEI